MGIDAQLNKGPIPKMQSEDQSSQPQLLKKWEAPVCIDLPVTHTASGIGCGMDGCAAAS